MHDVLAACSAEMWFNDIHKLNVNPSVEQILSHLTDEIAPLTSIKKRRLDLLLLSMKHYLYICKVFSKNPNMSELQTKLQMQWKIEHCSLIDLILQFSPYYTVVNMCNVKV